MTTSCMTSSSSNPSSNLHPLMMKIESDEDRGGGGRNRDTSSPSHHHHRGGDNGKNLPSFSDLLWCPDVVDGGMMSQENMNHSSQGNSDDPLADLNELELAALVGSPCNPTLVKNPPPVNQGDSNIPADISDLRSADLLQTIPGSIDIDKIFADFQAESSNNNNSSSSNNNVVKASLQQPRKVIITRKSGSVSDLVSAVAHRAMNYASSEENNNVLLSYEEKENQQQRHLYNNNNSVENNNNRNLIPSSGFGEPSVKARRFLSPPPQSNRFINATGTSQESEAFALYFLTRILPDTQLLHVPLGLIFLLNSSSSRKESEPPEEDEFQNLLNVECPGLLLRRIAQSPTTTV